MMKKHKEREREMHSIKRILPRKERARNPDKRKKNHTRVRETVIDIACVLWSLIETEKECVLIGGNSKMKKNLFAKNNFIIHEENQSKISI